MKAEVKPTEKKKRLVEYLKPRHSEVTRKNDKIIVKTEEPEKLARTPGIEEYTVEEETKDGLGGKPIHREAFTQVETRIDAAKAFLATVNGYTLYISTNREWDLRQLKKYNSEIKQADRKLVEKLDINELEQETELPQEKLDAIYREFLTE
ncbi:MAG: hypothetical protein ABEJ95_06630 [Candidatus Nanohalobium sp.]